MAIANLKLPEWMFKAFGEIGLEKNISTNYRRREWVRDAYFLTVKEKY